MTESSRPTVVVLFGGRSSEHQISCATAAGVLQVIDPEKWDVIPVGITPEGQWVELPNEPERYALQGNRGYTVSANGSRVSLVTGEPTLLGFQVDHDEQPLPKTVAVRARVDVVLPLLHGPFGEDGTTQGLLEISGVRYAGCGVTASAISMDKYLTKTVLAAAGLPVGRWETVTPRQWQRDSSGVLRRIEALGLPVFIKPCRAGSSMGISRVDSAIEVAAAIEKAQAHDPRVIVEAALAGREIECGVLQLPSGDIVASPLGEIVVESSDFYDYEAKYFGEGTVSLSCPADLPEQAAERIRQAAIAAFEALEGEGLSRVDFFYDPAVDEFTINEVNTMPGFTPFSMYPTMLQEAGYQYAELIDVLLQEAMARPLGLR